MLVQRGSGGNISQNAQVLGLDWFNQKLVERQKKVYGMSKKISDLMGKSASQLLEECGQGLSAPIDLSAILRKLDISALPMDFTSLEKKDTIKELVAVRGRILGVLISDENRAAIFYNKEDSRNSHRYRFTIAHEIAHCCLTGSPVHVEFRFDSAKPNGTEYEANVFAGELLIPQNLLYEMIQNLLLPSVHILADIFAVSDNVMLERLKYLKVKESIIGYNC